MVDVDNDREVPLSTRLRSNDPTLTRLILATDSLPISNLDDFLQALEANSTVVYVGLNRSFWMHYLEVDRCRILESLGRLKGLREWELFSISVSLQVLAKAVSSSTKLERLVLVMVTVKVSTDRAADPLQNHPSLQFFGLSDFRIDSTLSNPLDGLWNSLATCTALTQCEIFSRAFVEYVSNELTGEPQPPWTSDSLASLCWSVPEIQLRSLGMTAASTSGMLKPTNEQSTLQVLTVGDNSLEDQGAVQIVQAMTNNHVKLRTLLLQNNRISAKGLSQMTPFLLGKPLSNSLQKLSLARNMLGDHAAESLCRIIREGSLLNLDLYGCGLKDGAACELARTLQTNRSLTTLSLASNDISGETYVAFAHALRSNTTLASLNLNVDWKRLSIPSIRSLLDTLMYSNTTLKQLYTSLNRREEMRFYHEKIFAFLQLNNASRSKLLLATATREQWFETLLSSNIDSDVRYILVRMNPSLWLTSNCSRGHKIVT